MKYLVAVLGVILMVVLGFGVFLLVVDFTNSDKEIIADYTQTGNYIRVDSITTPLGSMRYMVTGNTLRDTAILFIHGAPGGMDMFGKFLKAPKLQKRYCIISVDRPGYGKSSSHQDDYKISFQAETIAAIFDKFHQQKFIIVGHSYGAPIALQMAALYPARAAHVILVGGAVSPAHERFEMLARIANSKPIRWMASQDTRMSCREKLTHVEQLSATASLWQDLKTPILMMHGDRDWMVPFENTHYAQSRIHDTTLLTIDRKIGKSHFFINDPDIMTEAIISLQ